MLILTDYASFYNFTISADTKSELSLAFKGLSEFEITQILNLAYQRIGDEAESVVIGGIGGRRVDHVVIALSVYFVSDAAGPSIVRDFTPAGSNFKKSSIDDVFPPIQAQFPPSSPPLP